MPIQRLTRQYEPIATFLDNLPLPVSLLDANHTIRFANRYYIEFFGLPLNKSCHRHLYDRKNPCRSCPLAQVIHHNQEVIRYETPGNTTFDVHYLPAGKIDDTPMVLQIWQNSTRNIETYTPTKERGVSHEILDALPEHIAIIDRNGTLTMTNQAWNEFARRNIRHPQRLYEGGNYLKILESLSRKGKNQLADFLLGIREIISGTLLEFSMEIFAFADGQKSWFLSRATRLISSDDELHIIIYHAPITELKKAENVIQKLAYFDHLTGLPNRLMLYDRLLHALDWAQRQDESIAVMFLDLDHFKIINDSLGHEAGDALLKSVAKRLSGCIRKSDTVARLGGDEFVILLANIKDFSDVTSLANKVLHALSHPFCIKKREIYTSTSIGISLYPNDADSVEKLIRNADLAMYQSKERGRNAYLFFADEMNERLEQRREMQRALHEAVERHEFRLFYQDQIDLATDRICGVEALLRWQHPALGLLAPDIFLEIAEESGLIIPIGNWVLKTACQQNKKWDEAGLPPLRVAINISSKQLYQMNLALKIKKTLSETGFDPARLLIEVTEKVIQSNFERAEQVLHELKELGIQIAIDNFGSGLSSFAQLRLLPVDRLNIDHPFIHEITNDSHDTAIVRSIITTAHNLGLKVIAEGVETPGQRDFLKTHGCEEIQGYNFLRPLPETEVTAFLLSKTGVG